MRHRKHIRQRTYLQNIIFQITLLGNSTETLNSLQVSSGVGEVVRVDRCWPIHLDYTHTDFLITGKMYSTAKPQLTHQDKCSRKKLQVVAKLLLSVCFQRASRRNIIKLQLLPVFFHHLQPIIC